MKINIKLSILVLLIPISLFAQIQIGNDINGGAEFDGISKVVYSSNGNFIAISAPRHDENGESSGRVRVYNFDGELWNQVGNNIDGESEFNLFGSSMSFSSNGDIIAIGAPINTGNGTWSGHVRVYAYDGVIWNQLGNDIDGESAYNFSGESVSLSSDGSIVAIGAPGNGGNGTESGHVRVYSYDGISWIQIGDDIDGEASGDRSGYSVSLSSSGNILAIGARRNSGNGFRSGHVRVYIYDGTSWNQIGNDLDGEASEDEFGFDVSLSSNGNILAIGGPFNDGNGEDSGHVRIYSFDGTTWNQMGNDIEGEASVDASGRSLNLSYDGSIVAIGASLNDGNGISSGHTRIYSFDSTSWNQLGNDIDGEDAGDSLGHFVSLSSDGSKVAIGAPTNDDNGEGTGQVRIYNLSALLNTDNEILSKFIVFPNPTSGQFFIQLQDGLKLKGIRIYNSMGQHIKTSYTDVVKVSDLQSGLYYTEIITNEGSAIKKVIID